jgi:hypothetical protein
MFMVIVIYIELRCILVAFQLMGNDSHHQWLRPGGLGIGFRLHPDELPKCACNFIGPLATKFVLIVLMIKVIV